MYCTHASVRTILIEDQKAIISIRHVFLKSKDLSDMNVFANKYLSYQIRQVNWENIKHKSIDVQLFI